MSKTDNKNTNNNTSSSTGAMKISSGQLINFLNQANSLQDTLRPHIAFQNKVNIYCVILNNIFSVLCKYTFLGLSVYYLWKHVIDGEIITNLLSLLPPGKVDWAILLIICSTMVLSSFVKRKWK